MQCFANFIVVLSALCFFRQSAFCQQNILAHDVQELQILAETANGEADFKKANNLYEKVEAKYNNLCENLPSYENYLNLGVIYLVDLRRKVEEANSPNCPVKVEISDERIITYKNKIAGFSVVYPFEWTEVDDVPFDSTGQMSLLNLALEEVRDSESEVTVSAIALLAQRRSSAYDKFIQEKLSNHRRVGEVARSPNAYIRSSEEYIAREGKYVSDLVFIEGKSWFYVVMFNTTNAAYEIDIVNFRQFLTNMRLSG